VLNSFNKVWFDFNSVMLEKWPRKGLESLKYMQTVGTAASRGCPGGWVLYDVQYRLRQARFPASSWGVVDSELWMFCVNKQFSVFE
jgi:hypothetical protein